MKIQIYSELNKIKLMSLGCFICPAMSVVPASLSVKGRFFYPEKRQNQALYAIHNIAIFLCFHKGLQVDLMKKPEGNPGVKSGRMILAALAVHIAWTGHQVLFTGEPP
jgi:hypothetical protein